MWNVGVKNPTKTVKQKHSNDSNEKFNHSSSPPFSNCFSTALMVSCIVGMSLVSCVPSTRLRDWALRASLMASNCFREGWGRRWLTKSCFVRVCVCLSVRVWFKRTLWTGFTGVPFSSYSVQSRQSPLNLVCDLHSGHSQITFCFITERLSEHLINCSQ